MKTMKKILAVTMCLMLLVSTGFATVATETRRMETAADAEEWIRTLLGDHPEELDETGNLSDAMTAALAPSGGMAGFAKQLAAYGTIVKIDPAQEGEMKGYQLFAVPCIFTGKSLDIVLVAKDGVIEGIQFAGFTGEPLVEEESDTYDSIDLALPYPVLDGELPGILTVPKGDGPFPVVILLQGSGASDKDEAFGTHKPFLDIAEGLAEYGIAVYRFDKPNYVYPEELAVKKDATLKDEYLDDAVAAVQLMAEQEKIDPERIFVLGHSLGANAIPAAARELRDAPVNACGFIMMAASTKRIDENIREQYDFIFSLMEEVPKELQAEKEFLFAQLDRLEDPDSLTEDDTIMGAYSAYWKWMLDYDILQAAEEITQPVLLLQGEEDYQVTKEDYSVWKEALGDRENWTMILYPGLTHIFMPGLKTEGSAAYERDGKVQENVIADIAAFVLEVSSNP